MCSRCWPHVLLKEISHRVRFRVGVRVRALGYRVRVGARVLGCRVRVDGLELELGGKGLGFTVWVRASDVP